MLTQYLEQWLYNMKNSHWVGISKAVLGPLASVMVRVLICESWWDSISAFFMLVQRILQSCKWAAARLQWQVILASVDTFAVSYLLRFLHLVEVFNIFCYWEMTQTSPGQTKIATNEFLTACCPLLMDFCQETHHHNGESFVIKELATWKGP